MWGLRKPHYPGPTDAYVSLKVAGNERDFYYKSGSTREDSSSSGYAQAVYSARLVTMCKGRLVKAVLVLLSGSNLIERSSYAYLYGQ